METCPFCEGAGECYDQTMVHSRTISPPYVRCPVCCGSGEVPKDELKNINCNRSVREIIKENQDEAKLARWEAERDDPVDRW